MLHQLRRDRLIERARATAASRPAPSRSPHEKLSNAVPVFLSQLAALPDWEAQHRGASSSPERAEIRFDITGDELRTLNRSLDDAIASAVTGAGASAARPTPRDQTGPTVPRSSNFNVLVG